MTSDWQPQFVTCMVGVLILMGAAAPARSEDQLPAGAGAAPPSLQPLPAVSAVAAAEKVVHELFASDYNQAAPSKQDRSAFAAKLLLQGTSVKDDRAATYVMLRDARDISLNIGEVDRAMEAIKHMAEIFRIDEQVERQAALATASKNDASNIDALLAAYADTAELAMTRGDIPAANKIITQGESSSRTRKTAARPDSLKRLRELREAAGTYSNLAVMQKKLEIDPANEQANAYVGRFICFVKGDFERGVPYLSHGNDAALKTLAAKDQAAPTDVEARVALAEQWWKVSDRLTGRSQRNVRSRAGTWYERCLAELSGTRKILAEKRIEEANSAKLPAGAFSDKEPDGGNAQGEDSRFADLVRRIPKDIFPTVSAAPTGSVKFESAKAREWVNSKVAGTLFDGTGEVQNLFQSKFNGTTTTQAEIHFPSGTVDQIKINGRISLRIPVDAAQTNPLPKAGDRVRVRGRISSGYLSLSSSNKQLTEISVYFQFDKPEWAVVK